MILRLFRVKIYSITAVSDQSNKTQSCFQHNLVTPLIDYFYPSKLQVQTIFFVTHAVTRESSSILIRVIKVTYCTPICSRHEATLETDISVEIMKTKQRKLMIIATQDIVDTNSWNTVLSQLSQNQRTVKKDT